MKVFYIDPNATTSQYNYPVVEELNNQDINTILVSSLNLHISNYYEEKYDIPTAYIFFKTANLCKNQKIRRIIKLLVYPLECVKMLRLIKQEKPDVIHYNWLNVPPVDYLMIKYLKKKEYPIVITQHNFIPHENKRMLPGNLQCLLQADFIICLSNKVKKRFPKKLQSKLEVINHGNTYKNELSSFTPKKSLPDNKINILMIGSIKPYKGVLLLMEAFKDLIKLTDCSGINLQIIGKCDEPLRWTIENYINVNSLNDQIETRYDFITYEEMFNYIQNCSLGVLPYEWGSQSGLPYLFYAFHKPLLLSNSCGISEQGNDKISVVTEAKVEDIRKGLEIIINNLNNYKASDFSEYLEENSIEKVILKIKGLYIKLVEEK